MNQPPLLLNTAQVAAWLGISPRTVCLWAECSELPAIRVGRQWRFQREAIERWLASSKGPRRPKDEISAVAAITAKAAYSFPHPLIKMNLR